MPTYAKWANKSAKPSDSKGFGQFFFWVLLRTWMNDMAKLLILLGGAWRLHDCNVIVKC